MSDSVYFYTFHKCASSLFSDYVLKNVAGLVHVDYASERFAGTAGAVHLDEPGRVYGPIRIPAAAREGRWETTACRPEFVRGKRALFMVRDPRDLLVSQYYSVAYSHALSPVPEIRERQLQRRERTLRVRLDKYVLAHAAAMARRFDLIGSLIDSCSEAGVLRYEDMIGDWPAFSAGLTRHLDLAPAVLAEIHARTRPREVEDPAAHQRSGKAEGFRDKLKPATVRSLSSTLHAALARFAYPAG